MHKLGTKLVRAIARCGAIALVVAGAMNAHADWDKIRASGTLKVAVYKDFAPFSTGSANNLSGIDVALAKALAEQMGLKLSLLPFDAGEEMGDDLRNMVWKGHYLGYGPADVMLHVPVERGFIQQQKQVTIFAPYYRETVVLAHALKQLPQVDSVEALKGQPLAAERGTAAASALIGALDGALRDKVRITPTPQAAVAALAQGEVTAVLATRAQIESALPQAARAEFGLSALTLGGVPSKGWAVGMAIKADDKPLAEALETALAQLRSSGKLNSLFEAAHVSMVAP